MSGITAKQMLAIGGREWHGDNGQHRIYLNLSDEDWERLVGLEIERYKRGTGNLQRVYWRGERISNARTVRMISGKIWWEAGELHVDVGEEIKADLYAALVADLAKH